MNDTANHLALVGGMGIVLGVLIGLFKRDTGSLLIIIGLGLFCVALLIAGLT